MNEDRDNRLPTGLIWLLIYQGILVLVSLCYVVVLFIELYGDLYGRLGSVISIADFTLGVLAFLVLAGWGTAMASASVGMIRRSPRGFLVGMICHLLVAILSMVGLIGFCSMGVLSLLSATNEARGFAPLFLLFALMWSPFALFSGWGFFYLRRLRKSLSA
jgi:hypothetical protein